MEKEYFLRLRKLFEELCRKDKNFLSLSKDGTMLVQIPTGYKPGKLIKIKGVTPKGEERVWHSTSEAAFDILHEDDDVKEIILDKTVLFDYDMASKACCLDDSEETVYACAWHSSVFAEEDYKGMGAPDIESYLGGDEKGKGWSDRYDIANSWKSVRKKLEELEDKFMDTTLIWIHMSEDDPILCKTVVEECAMSCFGLNGERSLHIYKKDSSNMKDSNDFIEEVVKTVNKLNKPVKDVFFLGFDAETMRTRRNKSGEYTLVLY